MTPYAETKIHHEDVAVFKRIRCIVGIMPDIDLSKGRRSKVVLSCHILAMAVSRVWDLECEHGSFVAGFDHSWVRTKHRNIIDVYPVATVGGPIMIDTSAPTLEHQLYRRCKETDLDARYGKILNSQWFRVATDTVATHLKALKDGFPATK